MRKTMINRKGLLKEDQEKGAALCQSVGGIHSQMDFIMELYERE